MSPVDKETIDTFFVKVESPSSSQEHFLDILHSAVKYKQIPIHMKDTSIAITTSSFSLIPIKYNKVM